MTRSACSLSAAALLLVATGLGCDRSHLSPQYGVATRTALQKQVIDPNAGRQKKPEQGLDPEEAAMVSQRYRKSLGPSNTEGENNRPSVTTSPMSHPSSQAQELPPHPR